MTEYNLSFSYCHMTKNLQHRWFHRFEILLREQNIHVRVHHKINTPAPVFER